MIIRSTQRVHDMHNHDKVWIIKRYRCGHYYVNQEICGRLFYPKFQRMTKEQINSIFEEAMIWT